LGIGGVALAAVLTGCGDLGSQDGTAPIREGKTAQFNTIKVRTTKDLQTKVSTKKDERSAVSDRFMQAAIEEARKGLDEGGIPIGSVLVIGDKIVGRGHNRRVQKHSAILHAEMDAIEDAGRLKASDYQQGVLYSTLSPCDMCSGTVLLYKLPKIVIGENRTFRGPEDYLRSRGVALNVLDDSECFRLMKEFIRARPELWDEDIGR
jgi:cytosine deaminase